MRKLFLILFIVSLGFFSASTKVSAEPGDPTNQMPSTSTSRHIVSTANGPGSYYSPNSVVYLYVPSTQATASVTLSYRLGSIYSLALGRAPSCATPDPAGFYVRYNPAEGAGVSISNSQSTETIVSGSTTYRVYCVVVTTTSSGNNYFELSTSTPGALMGAYPGGAASLGTGYAHNSAPSGYNANISFDQLVSFSAPCGITNSNAAVQLYDIDMYNTSSGNPMNPNIRVRMKRANKDGTNPVYLSLAGDFQAGGSASAGYVPALNSTLGDNNGDNVIDSTFGGTNQRPLWNVQLASGYYNPSYKYIIEVLGVRNSNLIRIKLPYDQIYAFINCATDRAPAISAVPDCTNNRIVITTRDFDHTGASNYAIQREYRIRDTSQPSGWTDWYAWAGITHTAGGTDYQRYYALNANYDFTHYQFRFRTRGTWPSGAPTPDWRESVVMNYGPCVRATCTVVSPPTVLYVNEANEITVRVTNNGTNDGEAWGASDNYQLRQISPTPVAIVGRVNAASGGALALGGTREFTFDVTPTDVGSGAGQYTWRMSRGSTQFGSSCGLTRSVAYRPPVVSCTVTPPIPAEAGTTGTVTVTASFDGPSNAASNGQVVAAGTTLSGNGASPRGPSAPSLPANIARDGTRDLTYNNFPFGAAGSATWNGRVRVTAERGYGGVYTVNATCDRTSPVGDFPYLKEFGGDVWTGGNFDAVTCEPPVASSGGRIFAFNQNRVGEGYVGAGAQLSVTALLNIEQFTSASNRSANNTFPAKGVTFANSGAGAPSSEYGGGFGADAGRCVTNYFEDTRDDTLLVSGSFPPAGPTTVPAQNIADEAVVTASSYHQTIPGMNYSPSQAVDGIHHVHDFNEWATQGQTSGNGVWLELNFPDEVTIDRVVLYDRPNGTDQITSGRLEFSGGSSGASTVNFGQLSNNGDAVNVSFPERTVRRVRMVVTGARAGTANTGLSEIEVWSVPRVVAGSGGFASGRSQYHFDGSQTFGDGTAAPITVPVGSQTAVFVDGDVYIRNNIVLAGGHDSIAEMANFALIVRGDIFIDRNVSRLDGLYIAQPDGTLNSGTIYTCATPLGTSGTPCTPGNIYAQGDNQLSVNGSLIANRIKFLRSYGSLREADFGEVPIFSTGAGTHAAEVINYTPQMYLAPSALRTPGVPEGSEDTLNSSDPYDSIRTLPPIF